MKKFGLLLLVLAMALAGSSALANISGSVFPTDVSCTGVNVKKFDLKTDVYLDGGPHGNSSTKLPNGSYYVQVTDPSGKDLLGTSVGSGNDTPVHVTDGSFDHCYKLWDIVVDPCNAVGYADTTNNGGVYKVWITQNYTPGEGVHGFIHDWSKTDNFKVGPGSNECPNPSVINVFKFDDSNANGVKDDGENDINDWPIDISDPCSSPSSGVTPVNILASPAGTWQICEEPNSAWLQTALYVDGVKIEPNTNCAAVEVISDCCDNHTVVFGNIHLGSITACKFYDRDGNGVNNSEPPVGGIRFALEGNDVTGSHISQVSTTDLTTGCVTFDGLLPGDYNLCEILPPGTPDNSWIATTDVCKTITLAEGQKSFSEFGNVCVGTADFDTKGYWHNKNGLAETDQNDIDYLNSLAPWSLCDANTKPFGPINGKYCSGTNPNGSNVPAVKIDSTIVAAAGTPKAEQSTFLVYKNSIVKLQLAQQLDAFIMNVRNRLGSPNAVILTPNGWISASQLITDAINTWISGTTAERSVMIEILDVLNNSNAVVFIHYDPCPVVYP